MCQEKKVIPIHKLLSRIRWDISFGDALFEIAYEDRMMGIIRIPLGRVHSIDSQSFSIIDNKEQVVSIPLHRIRAVFRNGDRIWSRKGG